MTRYNAINCNYTKLDKMQHNTKTILGNAGQYSRTPYDMIQYATMQCKTLNEECSGALVELRFIFKNPGAMLPTGKSLCH